MKPGKAPGFTHRAGRESASRRQRQAKLLADVSQVLAELPVTAQRLTQPRGVVMVIASGAETSFPLAEGVCQRGDGGFCGGRCAPVAEVRGTPAAGVRGRGRSARSRGRRASLRRCQLSRPRPAHAGRCLGQRALRALPASVACGRIWLVRRGCGHAGPVGVWCLPGGGRGRGRGRSHGSGSRPGLLAEQEAAGSNPAIPTR